MSDQADHFPLPSPAEHPILCTLHSPLTPYVAEEHIATGGEKIITRALDYRLDRYVALARANRSKNPDELEKFLQEGRLTANLSHPNIMTIHSMGLDADGIPFFSMDLIEGDDLEQILTQLRYGNGRYLDQYPLSRLLNIFSKICDAVAFAHSRKILHLDLKPANVRVGKYGEVILCDWGMARKVSGKLSEQEEPDQMAKLGLIKGSPGFMAPEQTRTDGMLSSRTDIYSLGAILYMMLTHLLPVRGQSSGQLIKETRAGNIIPPRQRRPDLPISSGLSAVTMKALAHHPQARYPSVQALQDDIYRYAHGFPTEAEEAGWASKTMLFLQRNRKLSLGLIASLLCISIIFGITSIVVRQQKSIAENNLSLYRKKQIESQQLTHKLNNILLYSSGVRDYISADDLIPLMQKIIQQNESNSKIEMIRRKKAYLHFVLQQFQLAKDELQKLSRLDISEKRVLELCTEYAAQKTSDMAPLPEEALAGLLINEKLERNLALFIYYHYMQRAGEQSPEQHVLVASAMLERINEVEADWIVPVTLTHTSSGGYALDLSYSAYSTFLVSIPLACELNILEPLQLERLDLSYSSVSLIRELSHLHVEELRMINVQLHPRTSLPWLLENMGIKRLIIGGSEYPDIILDQIRKSGILIIKEQTTRDE